MSKCIKKVNNSWWYDIFGGWEMNDLFRQIWDIELIKKIVVGLDIDNEIIWEC